MCGIHGIVNFGKDDRKPQKSNVELMLERAKHRGPDQQEILELPNAVLGMNRLAIVAPDILSTIQRDKENKVFAVFNGEIVNYIELGNELNEKPSNQSDSSIIIPMWKQYGDDFVKKLAGMFAIALYDPDTEELRLWRDPLGVKPLYYTVIKNQVIFSSEVKSIYAALEDKPKVSFVAIDQMLRHRFYPGRDTIFSEIKRVLPGEQIIFRDGKEIHSKYWELKKNASKTSSLATYDKFRDLFSEVVEQNCRGDVPGGYFVSGGLDSSLVTSVGLKNKSTYTTPISINFKPNPVVDEEYGKRLEEYLGKKFEWVDISDQDARQGLEDLVKFMDEPMENPIHIGTYFMAKKAHELGIKSVLTGDGSDEFFIGYARQACWFLEDNPEESYLKLLLTLMPEEALELYKPEFGSQAKPILDFEGRPIEPFTNIDQVLWFERSERLSEYHCMRLDRMTMAFGVEAKVPFLDHRIVDFTLQISTSDLFGKTGKEWLQKAAEPWVPQEIIKRNKVHFPSLPDQWLSGDGTVWMRQLLISEKTRINEWFNVDIVSRYIDEHERGIKRGRILWALVVLELWLREIENW